MLEFLYLTQHNSKFDLFPLFRIVEVHNPIRRKLN